MLRCYELNKRLLNHPAGLYFREPVDPVRHMCENYFDIIKARAWHDVYGWMRICVYGRMWIYHPHTKSHGGPVPIPYLLTYTL